MCIRVRMSVRTHTTIISILLLMFLMQHTSGFRCWRTKCIFQISTTRFQNEPFVWLYSYADSWRHFNCMCVCACLCVFVFVCVDVCVYVCWYFLTLAAIFWITLFLVPGGKTFCRQLCVRSHVLHLRQRNYVHIHIYFNMYVYIYIYASISIHKCIYVYIFSISFSLYLYLYLYLYLKYMYMYMYMYIHIHICLCVYMYVCIYIGIYVCV